MGWPSNELREWYAALDHEAKENQRLSEMAGLARDAACRICGASDHDEDECWETKEW